MSVKVAMIDDHPIVRQGLRNLLETEPSFQVIAEADDGITGLELVHRLRPDALIVDLMMPGLNGLDLIKQVLKHL
ncbi:MAG TPA: response regulator transcription factor, partial [Anaerolineales bacterium]|nr:response regulator transcription factor [Anaerolineales bacterium]